MINEKIENHNLKAIKRLNQRGGRMLSVVDLVEDGTLDRNLLEFLIRRIWSGDSILAAAGPSGTGKTTLMGALLNLIPPGIRIVTAEHADPTGRQQKSSALYMAHEINDAPYFGYIWGHNAREFLEAARENQIMATLHAESMEEVRNKLTRRPVGLDPEDFNRLDIIATMKKVRRGRETLRRVDKIYGNRGGDYRELFRWQPKEDYYEEFLPPDAPQTSRTELTEFDLDGFLNQLLSKKPRRLIEVRELLLEFVS